MGGPAEKLYTLQEYVALEAATGIKRVYAEHYTRTPTNIWNLEFLGAGSVLHLASIECEIPLNMLYEGREMLTA